MENFNLYFDNDEEFNNILGNTSYYKTMQDIVSKIVSEYAPYYVIEFGCGMGNTSLRLAKENVATSFVGVDNRQNIINAVSDKKELSKAVNLALVFGDLLQLDSYNLKNADLVLLMYSFNYIPDNNKKVFLSDLYKKMKKGSKLIIGDWFIPSIKTNLDEEIKSIYNARIVEGQKSLFWSNIGTNSEIHDTDDVERLTEKFVKYHKGLLKQIINKKDIYVVSKKWIIETCVEIGYSLKLDQEINNTNDAIIVFER